MLVHIIADYGFGDLAFAEVVQRIRLYLPDAEPILTPVPAFATLAAGFCVAQLGLNEAPTGTIIYHNVSPREDDEQARAWPPWPIPKLREAQLRRQAGLCVARHG